MSFVGERVTLAEFTKKYLEKIAGNGLKHRGKFNHSKNWKEKSRFHISLFEKISNFFHEIYFYFNPVTLGLLYCLSAILNTNHLQNDFIPHTVVLVVE